MPLTTFPILEVDNLHLEYRLLNPDADGPTLVLLHEGLGSVALWRDFPDELAARTGRPVFVYSRAGYGGSSYRALPWPLDYMQQEGTTGLSRVLHAAGIARYVLIGHSDGASIALVHAGTAPTKSIVGVVVMAPHVFIEDLGLASIRAAHAAYLTSDLRARLQKYHRDNVDCAFHGWSGTWLDSAFRSWNLESYLRDIRVPVLQIQGEGDQYGSAAQLQAIERGVRGAVTTHLLADCRHAPQFEQPIRTLAAIASFIEAVGS